jgi:outer membrane protein assembly factor BamA
MFGLGVSTYYGASGQAIAQFSDIMGDHRITLIGDMQMNFTDYAQVYGAYEYLKLRVNMLGGAFYYKYYSYDGRFRQYYHDLRTGGALGLSYPFSMFSRVDAQLVGSYVERVPLTDIDAPTLQYNTLTAILGGSYDNILWGITGPLKGTRARARFHISPPVSATEESYISADIDVRHYAYFFKRFVWANRLTAGGSLPLGENKYAARRFLLGGSENWFNYGVNIDNYNENLLYSNYSELVTPLRGWNYFDVTGDRMLLMNSEWRFPFIREVSTVWPLPMQMRYINGAFFIDGGYAWTREDQDGFLPIPPKLIGGYGFGMRANLGIFVLRYDRGWPIGRGKGGPINYFSLGAEF